MDLREMSRQISEQVSLFFHRQEERPRIHLCFRASSCPAQHDMRRVFISFIMPSSPLERQVTVQYCCFGRRTGRALCSRTGALEKLAAANKLDMHATDRASVLCNVYATRKRHPMQEE
jgi:hypothetical protein